MTHTPRNLRRWTRSFLTVGLAVVCTTPVFAEDSPSESLGSLREFVIDASGARLVRTLTPATGLAQHPPAVQSAHRGATDFLWLDTSHNNAIAEDVSISGDGTYGWVGWWLNNERSALYEMAGDNVPEWTRAMPSVDFTIGVDATDTDRFTSTGRGDSLYVFEASDSNPTASHWYTPGHVGFDSSISDNGSTYAAIGGVPGGDGEIRVYDGTTGTLRFIDTLVGSLQGVEVSADGSVVAATTRATVSVYDAVTGALRESVAIPGETQVNSALSGDGRYLITGGLARIVRAYEWNGTSYEQLWLDAIGGTTWVTALAISDDGLTAAAGAWVNPSGGHVVIYDITSPVPLWVDSSYGDWIADLDLTPDGGLLVAASWGSIATLGNVVSVYERNSSTPVHAIADDAVFGVGSCESVAISEDGSRIIAGGKSVHARVLGDGGWTMAIELLDPASVDETPLVSVPSLRVQPNPFVDSARIEAARGVSSAQLEIIAADGSLVRRLGRDETDRSAWNWDGRDATGSQVPAGVYYVRAVSDLNSAPVRIVRIR